MKQIYVITLISLCSILSLGVASAKTSKTSPLYEEYNFSTLSSSSSDSTTRATGGFEFDYSFIEDYPALGINLNLGGLVLFGEYQPISTLPEGVSKQLSWGAGAALNKRIYLLNCLYVEGRVGAVYHSTSITYESDSSSYSSSNDKETVGSWGGFAAPRAGLKLIDNICVNIGYKWNFAEFQFTEEYITEYMTVGVSFLF